MVIRKGEFKQGQQRMDFFMYMLPLKAQGITFLGKGNLRLVIRYWQMEIDRVKARIKIISGNAERKKYAAFLEKIIQEKEIGIKNSQKVMRVSRMKPILPYLRERDYFKEKLPNNREKPDMAFLQGLAFVFGKFSGEIFPIMPKVIVIKFPRKKGCLYQEEDARPNFDDYRVMKLSEFRYLQKNPEFAQFWVKSCTDNRSAIRNFLEALQK